MPTFGMRVTTVKTTSSVYYVTCDDEDQARQILENDLGQAEEIVESEEETREVTEAWEV